MTPADTSPLREALEKAKAALIKIRACSIAGCLEGYGKPELWSDALFASHGDVARALRRIDAALASEPVAGTVDLNQVLGFLNSIEGAGYGGMAEFEIARETVRRESALSAPAPAGREEIARIKETVSQFRECWHDAISETWQRAAERENFDGSDFNLNGFDAICDAILALGATVSPQARGAARQFDDLKIAAETFRAAMIASGAINHVGQDQYFEELRALECALNPLNYRDATSPAPGAADRAAGDEHPVLKQADKLHDLGFAAGWEGATKECAQIAEAIDSGRGNEKIIAAAIRALAPKGLVTCSMCPDTLVCSTVGLCQAADDCTLPRAQRGAGS